MYLNCLFAVGGHRRPCCCRGAPQAPREAAHGEYYSLLLCSVGGMAVLVGAQNTVTLFLGFELLSIPLYVLCATEMRRATSLESGLKYLIIGSVGSATLVYGLALLYGATGSTDFAGMARALAENGDLVDRLAAARRHRARASSAWRSRRRSRRSTSGRPTSTRARRRRSPRSWRSRRRPPRSACCCGCSTSRCSTRSRRGAPALAALATITIVVGNVGALGQTSLKRLLAWSSVAQAGYLLAGVVVATRARARGDAASTSPSTS